MGTFHSGSLLIASPDTTTERVLSMADFRFGFSIRFDYGKGGAGNGQNA
jgi:hypothetical protein